MTIQHLFHVINKIKQVIYIYIYLTYAKKYIYFVKKFSKIMYIVISHKNSHNQN